METPTRPPSFPSWFPTVVERGPVLAVTTFLALGGAGVFVWVFLPGLWEMLDAAAWVETPAVVVGASTEPVVSRGKTRYRSRVSYRYEFGGSTYESDREILLDVSRGSRSETRPSRSPGERVTCWVDPSDPSRAVLERGWNASATAMTVPLLLVVGAFAALVATEIRGIRAGAFPPPFIRLIEDLAAPGRTGPRPLRPATEWAVLAGAVAIHAAGWNLVAAALLLKLASVAASGTGSPDPTAAGAVTAGGVVGVAYAIAALRFRRLARLPRVSVAVEPDPPRPGEPLAVSWSVPADGAGRFRRLGIAVVPSAAGSSGSSGPPEELPVVDTIRLEDIRMGRVEVRLPGVAASPADGALSKTEPSPGAG
jgi:hypothetical protein